MDQREKGNKERKQQKQRKTEMNVSAGGGVVVNN